MLSFFNPEMVMIIRETNNGSEDQWGNPIVSKSFIASSGILAFRGTNENRDATGSTTLSEYKIIFADENIEIMPTDVFEIRGTQWQPDGSPVEVTPAFGGNFLPAGKVQFVKKVEKHG